MTGLSDQLTATLISGGVALIVALLGIGGAITAQLVTTRRTFRNSLALFERQHAEQERVRQESLHREDAHRFTEQRRVVYGRLLRTANDLVLAGDAERAAEKHWERLQRQLDRTRNPTAALRDAAAESRLAADEAREARKKLATETTDLLEEIQLIADDAVRAAADALNARARDAPDVSDRGYGDARAGFLNAARQELGMGA
ncbi:hypothetical protein [Actinomadura sp. 3N407]|uniref:hypothetical protein n=1 Tax=Actinomadura sp. 3N407 TaxID=3457423 RepID=UPI003FCCC4C8